MKIILSGMTTEIVIIMGTKKLDEVLKEDANKPEKNDKHPEVRRGEIRCAMVRWQIAIHELTASISGHMVQLREIRTQLLAVEWNLIRKTLYLT